MPASVLAALCFGSRTAPWKGNGNSPFLFIFSLHLSPICWISVLSQPARPLLTFISFSSCCALRHCLFHSQLPLFPLSYVDYLPLCCGGLSLSLILFFPVNSFFFLVWPTPFPVVLSSSSFPHPPQLLLLIYFPPSLPLSSPFNSGAHFVFICSGLQAQFG